MPELLKQETTSLPPLPSPPAHRVRRWVIAGIAAAAAVAVIAASIWLHHLAATKLPEELDEDSTVTIYDKDIGLLTFEPAEGWGTNLLAGLSLSSDDDTGAVTVESGHQLITRQGIDVSAHQDSIDWSAVAADGIEFAILRCGYRGYETGILHADSTFSENLAGAKAAGLEVGVYFYSQALNADEGAEEARFLLEMLGGQSLELPIFFDWEKAPEAARTDTVTDEQLNAAAAGFFAVIDQAGYDSGLYAYKTLAYQRYQLGDYANRAFWLAEYNSCSFYYAFSFWQYTDRGQVAGISGYVDRDMMILPVAGPDYVRLSDIEEP